MFITAIRLLRDLIGLCSQKVLSFFNNLNKRSNWLSKSVLFPPQFCIDKHWTSDSALILQYHVYEIYLCNGEVIGVQMVLPYLHSNLFSYSFLPLCLE